MNHNTKIQARRSFIFTPGLKPEMFPKALKSGTDMVCIELEDGIAPQDKEIARNLAIKLFKQKQENDGVERILRINCLREKFGIEDVKAILSAKNPPYVTSLHEWTYSAAGGPYGGYAMKQRDRTVFENSELAEMKKDEIRELIENEKSRKISNFLGGEILKLPKSASKESMIDKISKHFELNEKDIKTLSKENLVELAKSLEIVFYRGRFRMKPEDATKDNLINKTTK